LATISSKLDIAYPDESIARIFLVRYTHRPNGVIRLIGAGYWRDGRDYYENFWNNQTPQAPDL
jgi:hypothetical protein